MNCGLFLVYITLLDMAKSRFFRTLKVVCYTICLYFISSLARDSVLEVVLGLCDGFFFWRPFIYYISSDLFEMTVGFQVCASCSSSLLTFFSF